MNEHDSPTTASEADLDELGLNAWFAEEKRQEFLVNPSLVPDGWREFFVEKAGRPVATPSATQTESAAWDRLSNGAAPRESPPLGVGSGGTPTAPAPVALALAESPPVTASPALNGGSGHGALANGAAPTPAPTISTPDTRSSAPASPAPVSPAPAPASSAPATAGAAGEEPTLIRGAQARIVENMVASLQVPTATSVHPLPAKVLEVNRRILNEQLARSSGQKVSFTHLIGYAIVQALAQVPALNASFVSDADGKGTPGVVRHDHVGLGIAIDLERPGGARSLVVAAVKAADTLDFPAFLVAYEDIVRRARENKLTVEDFAGVTITLTNPGTLGTTQSVPRLMAGQGAIIGVGALDFPVEYAGTDTARLAELGVGKVLTLTSTYDHRIIQGAESGLFLKRVHELLVGERGFYDEVFSSLRISEPPAHLQRDRPPSNDAGANQRAGAIAALIAAYRLHGHRAADLDPLAPAPPGLPEELRLETFGLSLWDLDRSAGEFAGLPAASLQDVLDVLRRSYCGHIGVEYVHIQDDAERAFIESEVEAVPRPPSAEERRHRYSRLVSAELFERFLHQRFPAERRFSLEGGETTITFLDALLEESVGEGVNSAVIAMAHRGRLNVLANILNKPYSAVFADFEHNIDPLTVEGYGDVKYHKGGHGKWVGRSGENVVVEMASNPSHLEAVNPVVEGIVRAKLAHLEPEEYPILPVLVHGDAAFAGQGVVAETFNLSLVPGYSVGGSVHVVINNQLGFTTSPGSARSTRYSTDVAKMVEAPILHVNGADPDAVAQAAEIASRYRARFHKDVVVDLICWRLRGHNEGDDPTYTQPLMYKTIEALPSIREAFQAALIAAGELSAEEADTELSRTNGELAAALAATREIPHPHFDRLPVIESPALPSLSMQSGVERGLLDALSWRLHRSPEDFRVHPKLARQLEQREELYREGEVDWALAEALAYGSLLFEGTDIRLTGQDARRGTFSHRHAVFVDVDNGADFAPLGFLAEPLGGQAPIAGATVGHFEIRDSVLSEYSALAFEYGYSIEDQSALVIWEAQFGDFANGAQIVIDNFIAAGTEKWGQSSGLVLLLPHGYEGQGPEHSSARIERYLQLGGTNNLAIVQPTTAAQIFHLLRAQARRPLRCPLVVISPKSLLRARPTRSRIEELVSGTFHEVLDDPRRDRGLAPETVQRLVLCTGKIGVESIERRDALLAEASERAHTAVIRLEQLFPFPRTALAAVLSGYPAATELLWVQDEPANMGAWSYVREPLQELVQGRVPLRRVSRRPSGSPAIGSHLLHDLEAHFLLDEAVGEAPAAS